MHTKIEVGEWAMADRRKVKLTDDKNKRRLYIYTYDMSSSLKNIVNGIEFAHFRL